LARSIPAAGTRGPQGVTVKLDINGRADPAKAYIDALNKLMARRLRGQSLERRLRSTDLGQNFLRPK
jgi:hypothetical protein